MNWSWKRTAALVAAAMLAGAAGYLYVFKYRIEPVRYRILAEMFMVRLGLAQERTQNQAWLDSATAELPERMTLASDVSPFRKLAGLGELAEHREFNTTWFRGAVVCDVNSDGRLDLFFPNIQQTIAKATPSNVVGNARFKPRPNGLFLNMGNDSDGMPVYKSVQELQKSSSGKLVREELLFEGKYAPRERIDQPDDGPGRLGWGAVCADLDGDGRMDLYVLNGHFGIPFQNEELAWRIYPAGTNLGRETSSEPVIAKSPSFLSEGLTVEDGLRRTVAVNGRSEPEGRNTLYLNKGDADGDGIPEWEDATDATNLGGQWASTSAEVVDYDRDGDLDVYVTNFMDPDFTGFPTNHFAGNRNQLYKNMLVETGKLHFIDVADDDVAGLHKPGGLESYSYRSGPKPNPKENNATHVYQGQQVGEAADHSWASVFVDLDGDGWLDLFVANDQGNRFRAYRNLQGKGFKYDKKFNELAYEGCWMGMAAGDLDGDGRDEVIATNCGSQILSTRNTRLLIKNESETSVTTSSNLAYAHGVNNLSNALLYWDPKAGFQLRSDVVEVQWSPLLPPDQINPLNVSAEYREQVARRKFATTLAGLEFAFNAALFDADNDGRLDLYFAGGLGRGGDNFGDMAGSPGRFLRNVSEPGRFRFTDRTLETQLLDIDRMDYSHNPPRRPSPGSGWHKRDYVYVGDIGAYEGFGIESSNSKAMDIYRLHEQAACVLSADLNGDGSGDLLVTHIGGYTSNSPDTRNLKVNILGRPLAVPPVNKLSKAPTGFEPGATWLYINQNSRRADANRWLRIVLSDTTGKNVHAVGAEVLVNGRLKRTMRATQGGATCAAHEPLLVGLGEESARTVQVRWPSGNDGPKSYTVGRVHDRTLCIDRSAGVVSCKQP